MRYETRGIDMIIEYALNAVNQGVTSLGIKGMLFDRSDTNDNDLMQPSNQRHRPRHRKEVLITPNRRLILLQNLTHHTKHRHGLLRNGP